MNLSLDSLLNPIFKREVLAYLRAPWMRWAMGSYLMIPFIALAWNWPADQHFYGGRTESEKIVVVFFMCQAVLANLLLPVMGAFAISSEKKNRTYDFLFTTRMRPWTIGVSKLAAILILGFILTLCSLPVLSLVFFLGGVDAEMILFFGLLLASATILASIVPLFCSTIVEKGHFALVLSYVVLAILEFALGAFLLRLAMSSSSANLPAACVLTVTLIGSAILGVIIIFLTRRPHEETSRHRVGIIEDSGHLRTRRNQWPYYLIDPAKRPDPIADGSNPLLAKEQLTNPLFRSAWRWRCFYITLAVLLAGFLASTTLMHERWFWKLTQFLSGDLDGVLELMWLLSLGMAVGWTALTHAVAFAGEQEGGTIETLKLTRLTAGEFLRSKWLICWKLRWPYMVIMLAVFFFMTCCRISPYWNRYSLLADPSYAFSTALLSLLLIEVTALTATRTALFANTVRHALLWTFGIIFLILFVPYWMRHISPYTERLAVVLIIWAFICGTGTWIHIRRLWRHDE